ncbi:MAG: NYN domain-containing protein [Planctomycetes bacterium]|nr:NYN domain-containing protein [Planctomycetota bacterium]
MPRKVALFVDVESLHQHLRTAHNRPLDPALVVSAARARGDLVTAAALGDWSELPADLREGFAAQEVEAVQVDRAARVRDQGGRRRDVVRDVVDLEVLARIIEVLFPDAGGPEVDLFVVATADDAAARAVRLTRERFQKEVVVLGAEGGLSEALATAATATELLPMPPVEPRDLEGLALLVPLLEDLERRKRYLNFKYIRETVVRRLERVERSFDAAERLLSDAIGCGVLRKLKVEDKYNPGQLFTAYCLDRAHELFSRHGSGEPAPLHDDGPPPPPEGDAPAPAADAAATPLASGGDGRNGARRPSRGAVTSVPRPRSRRRAARSTDGTTSDRS